MNININEPIPNEGSTADTSISIMKLAIDIAKVQAVDMAE